MSNFSTDSSISLERKSNVNNSSNCNLEIENCAAWITKNNFKHVCLQYPDHILDQALVAVQAIKKLTQANIYLLADTSYSSCCVDTVAAAHVNADALIHYGDACLSTHTGIPVYYVFESAPLDLTDFKSCLIDIGLAEEQVTIFFSTKFHKQEADLISKFFGNDKVQISQIKLDSKNSTDVDCVAGRTFKKQSCQKMSYIYIGDNDMTLLNLMLLLPGDTWYLYNNNAITEHSFGRSKFLMKRLHLVEKLKDAQAVGILVGTLAVDSYLTAVERVKFLCKSTGVKCYSFAVGRPNVAKLANFPEIDVFVLISCLENPLLNDNADYFKPIVSLFEVELAFGGRPWGTQFAFDFTQLLPGGSLHLEPTIADSEEVEPDVSLITGKIRNLAKESTALNPSKTDALSIRDSYTVSKSSAATFLENRSWSGLQQDLGLTPVEKATTGRSGVPIEYLDEGDS